jgi:hypothetical protein
MYFVQGAGGVVWVYLDYCVFCLLNCDIFASIRVKQ